MRPVGRSTELEKRRRRAVDAVEVDGMTVEAAARRYGTTERTLYKWLALFREHGDDGLARKIQENTPAKLKAGQLRRLEKMLLSGARKFGFKDDLWTCPRIAEVVRKYFHVTYHPASIAKLLGRLGWTPQRPAKRAIERDEQAIARWSRHTWAQIKKKPPRKRRR